jgi:hypothetical protein
LKKGSDALHLLLQYFDKEYFIRSGKVANELESVASSLPKAILIAKESGLLYHFSQELAKNGVKFSRKFSYEIAKEERKLLMFKKTLTTMKQVFRSADLDIMFIKLYRGVPYVPRDIDILIKEEQLQPLTSALRRNGFTVKSFQGVENECRKEGLMKIDLYQDFRYLSLKFMDQEFLWKNPRNVDICGVNCTIPNLVADLVSLSLHDMLGHRCLSFLDFLYADSIIERGLVCFDETLQQPKKYHWENAFCHFYALVREIHDKLSSEKQASDVSFPVRFSAKFLFSAFGGFTHQEVSGQRKIAFIISTLMDRALLEYALFARSTSTELGESTRSNLLKPLHRLRHSVGDSKLSG